MKFLDWFLIFLMFVIYCGSFIAAFGWWGVLWVILSLVACACLVGFMIWREEVALEKLFNRGKKL